MNSMSLQSQSRCPYIRVDPEIVHGVPVFRGTRLPVDSAVGSYYAYMELEGMSDEEAIDATLKDFPTIPDGANGLRAVLAFEAADDAQLIR